MYWDTETHHQVLLKINYAIISKTSNEDFFKALADELSNHIPYDRLNISLVDEKTKSISHFAETDRYSYAIIQ